MASIGIGCISYKRSAHLQHWIKQVAEFSREDVVIHIAEDTDKDRRGVAYRSNECLRKLKDFDYVFILNDDVYPTKKGWMEFFIEASKQSGQEHFQLQVPSNDTKVIAIAQDKELPDSIPVNIYDNSNGCVMFFTKRCIETVGGYNEDYKTYGYEHADISTRIHRSGLTPFGAFSTPKDAEKYLYSLDLMPWSDLHKKLNHKGSMSAKEALKHVAIAKPVYQKPSPIYIPL